jgi:hypothetical protein
MRPFDIHARITRKAGFLLLGAVIAFAGCATNTRNEQAAVPEIDRHDKHGDTPLIVAASMGDEAQVRALLDRGANIEALDLSGNTALARLAAGEGYSFECIELLLSRGANPNHANYRSQTPLLLASMRSCKPEDASKQVRLYTVLIAAGANANQFGPSGELPLHLAAFMGQPGPALDFLMKATKDPRANSSSGFSAFSEAARGDRRDAESHLAGCGFEPQDLVPMAQVDYSSAELPNNVYSLTARAQLAFGDYLTVGGKAGDAAAHYELSAASFAQAIAAYNRVIARLSGELGKEKDERTKKIVGTVAINAVGIGLAAVTGVGFFAVPRSTPNDIGYLKQELAADKAGLDVLMKEDSEVEAKLRAGPPPDPPARR